jgi:hypothetical protein
VGSASTKSKQTGIRKGREETVKEEKKGGREEGKGREGERVGGDKEGTGETVKEKKLEGESYH